MGNIEEKVMGQVNTILSDADPNYLSTIKTPDQLINSLANELFFCGIYSKHEVDSGVKPILRKRKDDVYKIMQDIIAQKD
jgi:hypothetical protein